MNKNLGLVPVQIRQLKRCCFGLNWLGPDKLSGKVLVGTPTGSATPLVTSDPEYTVWFELNQGF